jgi:glycine/D-amino acid oxidase-like deaminating enzyme
MHVDYLIIGQGIAGTLLSHALLREGKSVIVIDQPRTNSSSKVAGAVINPLAGKHWTPSADYERYFPLAYDTYNTLASLLGTELIRESALYIFHENEEQKVYFRQQQKAYNQLLDEVADNGIINTYFRLPFGAGKVHPVWIINANGLLKGWADFLDRRSWIREEFFDMQYCDIRNAGVYYKDIQADRIIFCEGAPAANNPLFAGLPFTRNRGEALLLSIPGLPQDHIYHNHLRLIPKGQDLFWCGSNYLWQYNDLVPDPGWREETMNRLDNWLRQPYEVADHIVAERPTTAGQVPLMGIHPRIPSVAIFNGLGTRGFSSGPFLSKVMAALLMGKTSELPGYDASRFRAYFK